MDQKEQDKIMAFDVLFTNNHIRMLKIVIPYFDSRIQKQLAIYVKYLELQYTLSYYHSHSYELRGCSIKKEEFNISKIYSELLPYCTDEEKQKIDQITGLLRSMEMFKEMSKMFEVMKDLFPEGFGDDSLFGASSDGTPNPDIFQMFQNFQNTNDSTNNNANMNMTDMLMNMLGPEQRAMFEMFGGNNNESERMDE